MTAADAQEALDVVTVSQRFQMQWHDRKGGHWVLMEDGAAPAVWRPRPTAVDAAAKCLTWTGGIGIPAMQVVDMETGDVVWRIVSEYDPDAGEPISLPPAAEQRVHELAEAIYAKHSQRSQDAPDDSASSSGAAGEQVLLF